MSTSASSVMADIGRENGGGLLRTAIRLKQAIESIPGCVSSLGSIVTPLGRKADRDIEESEDEDDEDEDEEEDDGEGKGDANDDDKNDKGEESEEVKKGEQESAAVSAAASSVSVATSDVGTKRPHAEMEQCVASLTGQASTLGDQGKGKTKQEKRKMRRLNQSRFQELSHMLNDCSRNVVTAERHGASKHKYDYIPFTDKDLDTIEIDFEPAGVAYKGPLTEIPVSTWEALWQHAPVSGFGNVRTQTTDVDLSVRNARELTMDHVRVSAEVCRKLARLWSLDMSPARVRAVPYKLNVYGPGGGFQVHKDTPQAGLVGTGLIGLGDTSDAQAGLDINHGDMLWRAKAGAFLLMYTDVDHAVKTLKSGYRATLAFKLMADTNVRTHAEMSRFESDVCSRLRDQDTKFAQRKRELQRVFDGADEWQIRYNPELRRITTDAEKEAHTKALAALEDEKQVALAPIRADQAALYDLPLTADEIELRKTEQPNASAGFEPIRKKIEESIQAFLQTTKMPCGILLDHEYSLNRASLSGQDAILYDLAQAMPGYRVTLMPVLVRFHESCDADGGDLEQDTDVYPLTEDHIRYAMGELDTKPTTKLENVRFFVSSELHARSFQWSRAEDAGAELSGNESRSAEEDAVYVKKALIISRVDDAIVPATESPTTIPMAS